MSSEVESLGDSGIETLDAALATHKDALRQGREMLECTHCVLRMENSMHYREFHFTPFQFFVFLVIYGTH